MVLYNVFNASKNKIILTLTNIRHSTLHYQSPIWRYWFGHFIRFIIGVFTCILIILYVLCFFLMVLTFTLRVWNKNTFLLV